MGIDDSCASDSLTGLRTNWYFPMSRPASSNFLIRYMVSAALPGRLMAGQRPLEPSVEVRILPGQLMLI